MATLNVGGTKIKVGDEFLRMTPEQQSAAVEEIASQLQARDGQRPGNVAPSPVMNDALAAGSQASQRLMGGPVTPQAPQQAPGPDILGATAATLGGIVNGIPVIGPMAQNVSDSLVGAGAQLTGGDFGQTVEGLRARRAQLAEANPIANVAGELAGGIGAMGGIAALPGGAQALGMTGNLGTKVLNSAISGGGLSAADAMIKGGDGLEAGAMGAAMSGAVPLVGAGLNATLKALGRPLSRHINSVTNPGSEAARQVGTAVTRDLTANPGMVMNQADELVARQSGLPLINVDRGGETTRALARSVANQSPEARAVIQRTVDDRFSTQAPRAVEFIKRLTGGAVDDIGYRQSIKDVARVTNAPRYQAAFEAPQARAIWTPQIRNLMQSPQFRTAVNMAEKRGADKAAISGFKAVKNPFQFNPDGSIGLKVNPDGSRALPSLAFWNQVKINLDGMIERAQRGANPDSGLYSDLVQMKNLLTSSLDDAVPAYQKARQGAASFFGADDALDAGKVFANQPKNIPEARQAFGKFNGPEKAAFATGYASELIDKIKASGDRRNIIQQMFGSPAAREMNELVFGVGKARQLEAFVRVEALADQLRGAMGGSTTARQLQELGIGAGVGGIGSFGLSGGDWKAGLQGATVGAGAAGLRIAGQRIDARVMQEVAKLLTSDNPQALQRAVANATMSPEWMLALDRLQMALAAPARGTALTVVGQN